MNATIRFITHQFRRVPFARDPNILFDDGLTFGERLADRVAAIGGSWSFIIGFSIFLVAWALLNTIVLVRHAFDPFPFIFFNLLLSIVAAFQGPVIMMSQNRQSVKDRAQAETDFKVNLKNEVGIESLLLGMHELKAHIALLERQGGKPAAKMGS